MTERTQEEDARLQRERRTAFGAEVGVTLSRNDTLQSSLQLCAEAMVQHLDAAFARIWTLNTEKGLLELQASAGKYTHLDGPHSRIPLGQFKIGLIALERKPHLTNSVMDDPRVSDQEWARREGMASFAGYPLLVADQVVGVMAMFAHQPITEDTLDALALVADALAQTILRKRTEEDLRSSEELFRTTLRSIGDAVIATDAEGRITFMNRVAEHLTGWTEAEATGKNFTKVFRIINEQTREEAPSPIERALRERLVVGLANHTVIISRDGQEYPIEDSSAPIMSAEGNLLGAVVVFHDVTEIRRKEQAVQQVRKQAEEQLRQSETRFRMLVEQSPLSIQMLSPDGRTIQVNRAWEQLWGVTLDDLGDYNMLQDKQLADKGIMPFIQKAFSGEATAIPSVLYDPEQTLPDRTKNQDPQRWTRAFIYPVKDSTGSVREVVLIHEDITEQVEAEEARRHHQVEIEALNERLKRSIQETHHRVKNNLQIISSLVEVQITEAQESVPVAAMTRIGHHTRSLAALHDLLTHESKFDANTDSISTRDAMARLIPLLQITTGGRPIISQVDDMRLPVREGASLALLVSEMVSNAIKHGQGEIKVTLTVENYTARLEVCDDGPGFPKGFDPQTAANTGLALIDSTGRHDLRGSISYENRAERGGRVVVIFPVPERA